jgi:hypothetical protein
VQLVGEIVRHDADGVALMWADSDPQIALDLAKLLDRLQPKDVTTAEPTPPSPPQPTADDPPPFALRRPSDSDDEF